MDLNEATGPESERVRRPQSQEVPRPRDPGRILESRILRKPSRADEDTGAVQEEVIMEICIYLYCILYIVFILNGSASP